MKYTFVTNAVVSLSIDVEAGSLEEAIDLAAEAPIMSLCHQCCGGADPGEWGTELDTDQPGKLVALWCGDASKGESTKEFKAARKVFS